MSETGGVSSPKDGEPALPPHPPADMQAERPPAFQSATPTIPIASKYDGAGTPLWNPPARFPKFEILSIIILTALMDYLFYSGSGGLSWAIAALVLPTAILIVAPKKRIALSTFVYGVIFVLLAARYAWLWNPSAAFLGIVALGMYSIALAAGFADVGWTIVLVIPTCFVGPVRWVEYVISFTESSTSSKGSHKSTGIIVIPLAIAGIFAVIFLLSNPLLRDQLWPAWEYITDTLTRFWNGSGFTLDRVVFWLVCLFAFAALLRPFLDVTWDRAKWFADDESVPDHTKPDTGAVYRISMNSLYAVNMLFLAYNCYDAYYLVVLHSLPKGLNHSEYAHQGSIGLTIALALSTLMLGAIFRGDMMFHERIHRLRNVALFWVAQNFVLALWVFMRLYIYIEYNGLTRMRIVGNTGVLLVIVGLILVTRKLRKNKTLTWLLRRQLLAFALSLVLLAVSPLDVLVWSVNVPLIMKRATPRPAVQLIRQDISPEGLMLLPPLMNHPDQTIAKGAAAILAKWYFAQKGQRLGRLKHRWTEWQGSEEACFNALVPYESRILELAPANELDKNIYKLETSTGRWI